MSATVSVTDALAAVRRELAAAERDVARMRRDLASIERELAQARESTLRSELEQRAELPASVAASAAAEYCRCDGDYECNRCWARRVAAEKGWAIPPGAV